MHAYVRFDPSVFATPPDPQRPTPFKGGIVRSGTRFHGRVALDHRECIVNRVWASIDGERDEAADLAARTTIKVRTVGGCIVARMIRGKEISVSFSSPYVGKLVEIRRCRECRLGAIKKPMVAVYCIHGPWGTTDTRVVAARRLGAKVETCSLCGKAHRPHAEWSTDPDDLRFCGKRCRQRFHDLSHL